jgi:hypothetical protein
MTVESMVSNISNSNASVSINPVQIKLETVANQIFDGNAVNQCPHCHCHGNDRGI